MAAIVDKSVNVAEMKNKQVMNANSISCCVINI